MLRRPCGTDDGSEDKLMDDDEPRDRRIFLLVMIIYVLGMAAMYVFFARMFS